MTQETFERELSRRADDVHGTPLSFADVRGRARSLQRRRRASVAGAVAAVVALVVVVPSALTGGTDKGSRAPEPAPSPPGHTAVLHDGTLTLADGGRVDLGLDNQDVTQLGVLTDGRTVVALQKPYGVRVYSADGATHVDYPAAYNVITMSPRDDAVAWVSTDRTARVLASNAAEPVTLPGEVAGSIDAVLDAEHLLVGDSPTTTGELTPDGITPLETDEPFRVIDVSPDGDLWAVAFVPTVEHEDGGCSGLYDPETDQVVARDCSAYHLTFAPDGQHVVSGYYENNMVGNVRVLDLDLQQVAAFDPPGASAAVSRVAWDDADHLLVSVTDWQDPTWSLERVDLDGGDPVVLDGPAPGRNPEMVAEYLLSE
ncbi:MAG TPA: hypothetical protein VFT70_14395 [Nocardioides sp.]|nr:hypothetical protein [Nocardioides sp.]